MLILRDYQESSLDKLRTGFVNGHRVQMLYAPTGSGKTETALSLLKATAEKGNKAAMILDRRILCDQTSARLDKYRIDHGVLMAGHWNYSPSEHIQICSAQTLEAMEQFPGVNLLVIDEAHCSRRSVMEFVKNCPHIKVIGLSASPFTKGLGDIYTNVINATTTKELVDSGQLSPLRVFVAKEIDMSGAKKVAGEWSQKEATERGVKITGDVVAEWHKKTMEIFNKPAKTIVFSAGVTHGKDMAAKFNDLGICNFVSLSYKDDDSYKTEVLAEFSKVDSCITGLVATDILTKGFDQADVMIGISARPFSKSFSSHVQQLGRVMRPHHSKDAAIWLDHSGNYLRFKSKWDELYSNGVSELDELHDKAGKEPTEREKTASKCPKCGCLRTGADICPHCGFTFEKRNKVNTIAGEMQELILTPQSTLKFDMAFKERWYRGFLFYARSHKKRDGTPYMDDWATHKYKEKFGEEPHFNKIAEPTSPDTAAWITSRNIRYSKLKNKNRV